MNERFALIMTRASSHVTPAPADITLAEAINTHLTPLAIAVRDYAQADTPGSALPGVRLIEAERLITGAFNDLLTALHAQLDEIDGRPGMPLVEHRYQLLLGQMLGHQLRALFDARAEVAHLRGEDPHAAVLDEVKLVRRWAAIAGSEVA